MMRSLRQHVPICWAALMLLILAGNISAAPAEVRGTWLTTTGSEDHIRSGNKTEAVMSDLRNIGLNTVYVETWKNGYTNFPSPSLSDFTGWPDRSTFLGSSRDLVEETLIHAHRNGHIYFGWFEYGFAAQFIGSGGTPNNPLAAEMRDRGWLLEDQDGNYGNASNGFAWMNPAVPEVRELLIDITLEAVNRYDLDGIQFDDRLAWPREFGWDTTTGNLYQQETGRLLPRNVDDAFFRDWRQEKVTQFADELFTAIKTERPDLHVSVSPSITGFSDVQYNAPWADWVDQGLFDEYVPQAYRSSLGAFNGIVDAQVAPFEPDELEKLILGLRINGGGGNTPATDVLAMIDRVRAEGVAGHSLWYSRGVRDEYASQLTSYYDVANLGPAVNPLFDSGHRPAPLIATSLGGDVWQVDVSAADAYRIVAEINGRWREVMAMPLAAGLTEIQVPGASEVELLVDRRPPLSADFNGNGIVDAADYTYWRDSFGQLVTAGTGADLNRNGLVDSLDYQLWRQQFGQQASSSAEQVPEPASLFVSLVLAYCALPTARWWHRQSGGVG